MIAIDTSVVCRVITADDPVNSPRARALVARELTWLGATVVLEAFWVLTKIYRLTAPDAAEALLRFIAIMGVTTDRVDAVRSALISVQEGLEFPDALHAALAEHCMAFATFDGDHRKRAGRMAGGPPVVAP